MRFLLALLALPVLAHTLYFLPARFHVGLGEPVVFSIHNGDSFPQSDDRVAPGRLAHLYIEGASGRQEIGDLRGLGKAVHGTTTLAKPGTHWLVTATKPNQITLPAAKFEDYLREEGLGAMVDWRAAHGESALPGKERYSKFAKSLIVHGRADGNWNRTLGLPIEFVLEQDPATVKAGESLPVRLIWGGKPAAGVQVERAWAPAGGASGVEVVGRTDSEGRIAVKLDRAARWRIHAVAMKRIEPGAADGMDWESNWATVTFEWTGEPASD